jgi:SulP family sulfate permease
MLYSIEGPLFFAAAETFERVLDKTHADPRVVVIRLRRVPFVDITGMQALQELVQQLHGRGVQVYLCEANKKVLRKLLKAGVIDDLGRRHYFARLGPALDACDTAQADPEQG